MQAMAIRVPSSSGPVPANARLVQANTHDLVGKTLLNAGTQRCRCDVVDDATVTGAGCSMAANTQVCPAAGKRLKSAAC